MGAVGLVLRRTFCELGIVHTNQCAFECPLRIVGRWQKLYLICLSVNVIKICKTVFRLKFARFIKEQIFNAIVKRVSFLLKRGVKCLARLDRINESLMI